MGLIARAIEQQGVPTIMVTIMEEIPREMGVPRAIYFPHKLGSPIGRPGEKEEQYKALAQCLHAAQSVGKGQMHTADRVPAS